MITIIIKHYPAKKKEEEKEEEEEKEDSVYKVYTRYKVYKFLERNTPNDYYYYQALSS